MEGLFSAEFLGLEGHLACGKHRAEAHPDKIVLSRLAA